MRTVNPSSERVAAFQRETPDDEPIVMVNLLKYRERADYPGGAAGGTGRQAYARYGKAVLPLLWEVGGQVVWMGKVRTALIAPDDESWDDVALVHYPARRAFLRMVTADAYQAILHHRTAALLDSRLVETRAVWLPRWALGAARGLLRVKTRLWPRIE